MILERFPLCTLDGNTLETQWARPESAFSRNGQAPEELLPAAPRPPVAAVLFTHGLGEYSSRYGHVLEHLTSHGLEVFTYDVRGHGRSSGRRGDAPGFKVLLDDLALYIEMVQERRRKSGWGDRPLFLYGHSMGGLITLSFLQTRRPNVAGAIIASPWLRLAFEPPRWKLLLGRVARAIYPGLRQLTGLERHRLSRDPEFLQSLPDLDLAHQHISARLFYDILDECDRVFSSAGEKLPPLLLIHGQADPITSWTATSDFYELAGADDKTLKLYPEATHETHNDLDRQKVLDDITTWLEAHLSPPLQS